jgi:hypothetical protein
MGGSAYGDVFTATFPKAHDWQIAFLAWSFQKGVTLCWIWMALRSSAWGGRHAISPPQSSWSVFNHACHMVPYSAKVDVNVDTIGALWRWDGGTWVIEKVSTKEKGSEIVLTFFPFMDIHRALLFAPDCSWMALIMALVLGGGIIVCKGKLYCSYLLDIVYWQCSDTPFSSFFFFFFVSSGST